MWYVGNEFDREKNKSYKTLDGGLKAARRQGMRLYDEAGKVVEVDAVPSAPGTEEERGKQERADGGLPAPGAEQVEIQERPEEPDAEHPVPGAEGQAAAEAAREEKREEFYGVPALCVNGKIKRVFDGNLRIRNRPSWDNSVVRGVSAFKEKKVTHLLHVDGKLMYRTSDGYFVSGEKRHVVYVESE